MKLTVGDSAPDFTLKDQNDKAHSLADYSGKWLLLYFYPKDFTPGCTTQACGIRDGWQQVQSAGLTIVGVSKDSVDKHHQFATKYQLPFQLLSDESGKVIKAYGSLKATGVSRDSFLIDPDGKIAKIYRKVNPAQHLELVLEDFKQRTKE